MHPRGERKSQAVQKKMVEHSTCAVIMERELLVDRMVGLWWKLFRDTGLRRNLGDHMWQVVPGTPR